jgi:alkylhydroperoxidase/carboxymuconolactone decarboxylase family protein YurZ
MVAETSAWGRALVAIGADTKNGIASANEVEARKAPVKAPKATPKEVMELAEVAVADKDLEALRRAYSTAESIGMDQVGLDTIKAMAATLTATNE